MKTPLRFASAIPVTLGFLFVVSTLLAQDSVAVGRLRCEYQVNPLGIGVSRPRLSWDLESGRRDVIQTAYRIQAAASLGDLTGCGSTGKR